MLASQALYAPICASCRLQASIATKRLARSRKAAVSPRTFRSFSLTRRLRREDEILPIPVTKEEGYVTPNEDVARPQRPEDAAFQARKTYGDALPEGELSEEEYKVYERLYGTPLKFRDQTEILQEELAAVLPPGTGVLKEVEDGVLEEVEFELDEVEGEEDGGLALNDSEGRLDGVDANARLAQDIQASLSGSYHQSVDQDAFSEEEDAEESYQRTHPLTLANRFATSPSTLSLPKAAFLDPVQAQLSGISNTHLSQAAYRLFGGAGLPYSTSTPALAKTMQQKPIPLEASQSNMSEIEGDTFMGVIFPGMYASIMSVLVETRKRLGTAWAEELVEKAENGELRILDAGGGGAGVLAVRELLRAEWERIHESSTALDSGMALAEADGRAGGPGLAPPLGHATVLTGSSVLRRRASLLLENTTFIPRLPDYVHTEQAGKKGKFDIVVAPHTLWGLREDYIRKTYVQNLWSLLSRDGGVLLLLEKGIARGFEVVAAAREMLLTSQLDSHNGRDVDDLSVGHLQRDRGMVIAPCTNHGHCPMYQPQGMVKGRRDICHFSQRYVRPPFLQAVLGARDKNFEDVKFSYLSIMRGRDLRDEENAVGEALVQQDDSATQRAFAGYEIADNFSLDQQRHLGLSLPRAVLPPLKRRGHVILDLCTPSGTLERWTVPKSFSKQAFRDARKSAWGDLWALGAKTSVPRTPKVKKRNTMADMDVRLSKGKSRGKKGKENQTQVAIDHDEYGQVVIREPV